ncbi:MAG: hypothetical protein PVH87_18825 [Desulfobacteraceae bacterium]|jgi:hypothetical protein
MAKRDNEQIETLIGVVTPVAWDDDRVSEVALFATDDEEYRIENGTKFIDYLQQCIEATGRVRRTKKAFRSINIKRFKVLESI